MIIVGRFDIAAQVERKQQRAYGSGLGSDEIDLKFKFSVARRLDYGPSKRGPLSYTAGDEE